MKVTVDTAKCSGHAQCFGLAPDVYELDDDGYCIVDHRDVPPQFEKDARDGAAACPEQAITIDE